MKCAVIGAGSWGTALGMQLARCGHDVVLWDHDAPRAVTMDAARENARYLPGLRFPDGLHATGDLDAALLGAELVVAAVLS